jgi:anti-sigma factor RsiW
MSQILEQQLSVFLDGELPANELDLLLTRLDRDPAHRATLARYAMIGECVRSGVASPAALGVAERVRSALLADTTPVVPQALPARAGWRGWLMVAGPQQWSLARQPALKQDRVAFQLMNEPLPSITAEANHRLNPRAAARLTSYLVAHGQYTSQLSRSTFDSHLVTARAERASWHESQDMASVR